MKALVVVIAMTAVGCGVEQVDTGHRGVETRFGKVVSQSLPEGLYFYNPFTSDIDELDVREQKWKNKTLAYTKDVQNVAISFTLNLLPDSTYMHQFYKDVGPGKAWMNKIVPQLVKGNIKEIVGQYKAVDLISKRLKATDEIQARLTELLLAKHVTVKNFEITDLNFNDAFEAAVERKVIAVQHAHEAKNKTVRIREEAKQKLIDAKAQAESMRIRAQALTKNKNLVSYEAVQKWNGVLPKYSLSGAVPFLNLNTTK